jgi:hypothetical protein
MVSMVVVGQTLNRDRHRRLRFARLAQEAEGAGSRLATLPPSLENFEEKIRNHHNGNSGNERDNGRCCTPNNKTEKVVNLHGTFRGRASDLIFSDLTTRAASRYSPRSAAPYRE